MLLDMQGLCQTDADFTYATFLYITSDLLHITPVKYFDKGKVFQMFLKTLECGPLDGICLFLSHFDLID